jgi:hypothetical protein
MSFLKGELNNDDLRFLKAYQQEGWNKDFSIDDLKTLRELRGLRFVPTQDNL